MTTVDVKGFIYARRTKSKAHVWERVDDAIAAVGCIYRATGEGSPNRTNGVDRMRFRRRDFDCRSQVQLPFWEFRAGPHLVSNFLPKYGGIGTTSPLQVEEVGNMLGIVPPLICSLRYIRLGNYVGQSDGMILDKTSLNAR